MMPKHVPAIVLVRVYEITEQDSGYRVLVDRIWPRGIKKEELHLDAWMKELAPSTALRQWFNHDPARWSEFREKYFRELEGQSDQVAELRAMTRNQPVLLIYGARDQEHNNAVALRDFLMKTWAP
jgi:uncharacterized protein YeaO (DUF488 family)